MLEVLNKTVEDSRKDMNKIFKIYQNQDQKVHKEEFVSIKKGYKKNIVIKL